jgi:hypothetical protein
MPVESQMAIQAVSHSGPLASFRLAETDASGHASAACYHRPEHVGIAAVVVPELKFRGVEWQIFGANFVERADHAAFEDRPEAFNRAQ